MSTVQNWTGRESRALREAMRLSIRDFAARIGVSDRAISHWERDYDKAILRPSSQALLDTLKLQSSPEETARFERILYSKEDIIDSDSKSEHRIGTTEIGMSVSKRGETDYPAISEVDPSDISTPISEFSTQQSNIQVALPENDQIEVLRRGMNSLFQGSASDASIEEWEQIVTRYARATRDRAATVLLGDLSQDLSELSQLMHGQIAPSAMRRLTRISAQMSGLMLLVFCLLDDRRSFRKWARTASLIGNESGDLETLSWVLAQESYGHYYSGDFSEAIDVSRRAIEVVNVPCVGSALASALEARACAVTSRNVEAKEALSRTENILSRLNGDALTPSAFGYNEASFRFHEGNAYTHMRDFKSAMRAQDRALELCPPDNYADWAMTRFDRAQCLIYSGDIPDGLQYASETINKLPSVQRKGIIPLRGNEIIAALPETEKKRSEVRDFRELLTVSACDSEVKFR